MLEHDPEKWIPVFGERSCSTSKIERDDDSKKSHLALMSNPCQRPLVVTEIDLGVGGEAEGGIHQQLVGALRLLGGNLQLLHQQRDALGMIGGIAHPAQ